MNMMPTVLTAVIAFGITSLLGIWLIPYLNKLKYGQTILDIGPSWHKSKQGTPTMGGLMFVAGIIIAAVTGVIWLGSQVEGFYSIDKMIHIYRLGAGIIMATAFGFLGFLDDYVKVVKKRNLGLTARQKLLIQLIIGIFYLSTLYLVGDRSTVFQIPFIGQLGVGLFYYPISLFIIIGFVNAVNLTDGVDGLAPSVTFVAALGFMVITTILGFAGMTILATALAGGCLGFLIWNFHPAKVFMGDTGSMFLGGIVVALGFGTGAPLLLILIGIVYLCEAFSVILQVISFKTTGKRIFKMSPIHHHYEMSGFSEVKIVVVFSLVGLLGAIAAVIAVLMF